MQMQFQDHIDVGWYHLLSGSGAGEPDSVTDRPDGAALII
jgi:hypothetical protein